MYTYIYIYIYILFFFFHRTYMRQKIQPFIFLYKDFFYSAWTVLPILGIFRPRRRMSKAEARRPLRKGRSLRRAAESPGGGSQRALDPGGDGRPKMLAIVGVCWGWNTQKNNSFSWCYLWFWWWKIYIYPHTFQMTFLLFVGKMINHGYWGAMFSNVPKLEQRKSVHAHRHTRKHTAARAHTHTHTYCF